MYDNKLLVLCDDCYSGDCEEYTMRPIVPRSCAICHKQTQDHLVPKSTVEILSDRLRDERQD